MSTVRERNPDRASAQAYAEACGFFWLPCPRCGEWFGGHEHHRGDHGVRCLRDGETGHLACCPPGDDASERAACERVHERRRINGEEP